MKTKIALLSALTFASVAFAAADATIRATPSTAMPADAPQRLDKFMVTGSLADPADAPQKLDKFMVTGSLADPADAPQRLEKFMVTGSMAKPVSKRDRAPARLQ